MNRIQKLGMDVFCVNLTQGVFSLCIIRPKKYKVRFEDTEFCIDFLTTRTGVALIFVLRRVVLH